MSKLLTKVEGDCPPLSLHKLKWLAHRPTLVIHMKGEPSPKPSSAPQAAFTLVELLIVIVVIAILVAIAIISYRGIIGRTNDSLVNSDLRNNSRRIQTYIIDFGKLPTGLETAWTEGSVVDFKFEASSRKAYRHFSFCTGNNTGPWLNPVTEIILMAESSSGKSYVYSTSDDGIHQVEVEAQEEDETPDCFQYLRSAQYQNEHRYIIRTNGAVETQFITIKGE